MQKNAKNSGKEAQKGRFYAILGQNSPILGYFTTNFSSFRAQPRGKAVAKRVVTEAYRGPPRAYRPYYKGPPGPYS